MNSFMVLCWPYPSVFFPVFLMMHIIQSPGVKFLMQIVCGVALVLTGTHIALFDNMALNYLLTVFWVVGIMNAVNLIDNMDGIATIVVIFIILSFIAYVLLSGVTNDHFFLIFTGVAASLIAFLKLNWWPSKMYMGDTGSMFLGVFIAAFSIVYLWNAESLNGMSVMPVSARILSVAIIFCPSTY
jgi:UDP-GlcNAc:undecaprenyl-phosphate/decaprenyl-phosphate GlcNAc-1-phosphate transferase